MKTVKVRFDVTRFDVKRSELEQFVDIEVPDDLLASIRVDFIGGMMNAPNPLIELLKGSYEPNHFHPYRYWWFGKKFQIFWYLCYGDIARIVESSPRWLEFFDLCKKQHPSIKFNDYYVKQSLYAYFDDSNEKQFGALRDAAKIIIHHKFPNPNQNMIAEWLR